MKGFSIFPKRESYLPYVYLIYITAPLYNISQLENNFGLVFGFVLIGLFLLAYRQLYWVKTWGQFTFWVCVQIGIVVILSIWNTPYNIFLGFYPGFFIGWITDKKRFQTLMAIFITTIIGTIYVAYLNYPDLVLFQILLFLIVMIGSPFGFHNFNKQMQLEKELDKANKQVKELVQKEERHRIARDLHDTLGHTLSLITLQSQLVQKLIKQQPEKAVKETREIEAASRAALKQTRELVSAMRTLKVDEEIKEMEKIVTAAGINFTYQGPEDFSNLPPLTQNMVAMCIREAGTNIVKHSQATTCSIDIRLDNGIFSIVIQDDGTGIDEDITFGNGLKGMKERLTFIEGEFHIINEQGTCLNITVPLILNQKEIGI